MIAAQVDFVACGDFNMKTADLTDSSLEDIDVLLAVPRAATCRPTQIEKHSIIDYYFIGSNLASRVQEPRAQEDGTTAPHLQVHMELAAEDLDVKVRTPVMPKGIIASPPIGCARSVEDRAPALAAIRLVSGAQDLPPAWDKVLTTVEDELLDRYDAVGPGRKQYQSRAGEVATELKTAKWASPGRRTRPCPQALA
eukprot:8869793-Pyramimonas_sp.AAC.1